MKLDRELQRKILEKMSEIYPSPYEETIQSLDTTSEKSKIGANISYLVEHKLVCIAPDPKRGLCYKITAKGMDFLQDDGGLSAILGTVTVRLHADTIKDLVEARIVGSAMPETEKKRFIDTIRSLPAEATRHLAMKLIDIGLDKAPSIGGLIKLVIP